MQIKMYFLHKNIRMYEPSKGPPYPAGMGYEKKAPPKESFLYVYAIVSYSTVTDLARLRGWSTSQPRITAM